MWFSVALLLVTGQLPNPLMSFARDGSEHPIAFSGPTAELDGTRYDYAGRSRYTHQDDAGGCDGATPELLRSELALRPEGIELKQVSVARPCRGREKTLNTVVRRYTYEKPTETCSTQPRPYTLGDQTLQVSDGCDDTVVIADGERRWVLSGKGRRFTYGSGGAALRLDGVPGDTTLRIKGKALPAGTWTRH